MFLYYFKESQVNEDLPYSTQEEIVENFKEHQRKLWDVCWLIGHCKADPAMPNRERKQELLSQRLEQIKAHMQKIGGMLTKANRSKLWLCLNNEKWKMNHEK